MSVLRRFIEECKPIVREAANDVRATIHETYGKAEHAPEPGTPMAPTQREVYEQKHETEKQPETELDMEM